MPLSAKFMKSAASRHLRPATAPSGGNKMPQHSFEAPPHPDFDAGDKSGDPGDDAPASPGGSGPHPALAELHAHAQKHGATLAPGAPLAGLPTDQAKDVLEKHQFKDGHGHNQNLDIGKVENSAHHVAVCSDCLNGAAGDEQEEHNEEDGDQYSDDPEAESQPDMGPESKGP